MPDAFERLVSNAKEKWESLHSAGRPVVLVGMATCGRSSGAEATLETFRREVASRGLDVKLVEVGCLGPCYAEPLVVITLPEGPAVCYRSVDPERAAELVERCLARGEHIPEYAMGYIGEGAAPSGIMPLFETPGFKGQVRRILRNCGLIDPTDIDQYLALGGYRGLVNALRLGRTKVIEELKVSGLRGRGGAGFPTWKKWQFCIDVKSDKKFIVCNADEGDPGAFMNRSLLESDPHSVIEGMVIAGFTLGADEGYIYCRAEYPLAIERLKVALAQAERAGLLGKDILGAGFDLHIHLSEGAGAFVCGEETALIASIEGRRGMPRARPPFPAVSGLWGKPTVINNVETYASVALILQKGADWFAQYGTPSSKGTKTFSLVGKVKRPGLVEVPLGITLRQMIFDIGGGLSGDRRFKAVQTGGPSGGCIPESLLDIPVDYESLKEAGSIMGSGGMVVMDEDTCMVDFARYFTDFTQKESCGKCVPCRLGTRQMLDILTDITQGRGRPEDLELLDTIAQTVKRTALCGLGQTAPNPVLTSMRYFRNEYEDHVHRKRCAAASCQELVSSPCQHTCPIGTEAPLYIALIAQGRLEEAWDVIRKDNPLPSVCARVCHHPCEAKCQAGRWGEPIAIRALKRFVCDKARAEGRYIRRGETGEGRRGGKKVAIIGSGPAGLAAGWELARRGHEATIFEAERAPGGALLWAIPAYRLPKDILELDIENIKAAGVEIRTGVRVGKDIPFEAIRTDFGAVFIATGAHKSRRLGVPGEDASGVFYSMEFLKKVNLGEKVPIGGRVAVVGGGNSAVDAARTARRLPGVEKVSILYRRSRQEMPAFEEEIAAALEESIELVELVAPSKVIASCGAACAIECVRMELGPPDESGRRRPVPIKGSEFAIDIDALIVAIGEEPDLSFLPEGLGLGISKSNTIIVNRDTLATNVPGVFAGGDVVTGPNTVIDAIASGKLAAEMIDKYLRGEPVLREFTKTRPSRYIMPVEVSEEELEGMHRAAVPALPADARRGFEEVEGCLSAASAMAEARRCLRCDLQTSDGKRYIEAQKLGEGAPR